MKKLTSFNWVIKLLFMLGLMVAALFLAMPAEADDSSAVVPVTAPTVLTNQSVSQTNPTQVATSDAATGTTDPVTASSTASSTTTPSNSASSAAAPSEQSNDQGNQLSATKVNLQVTVNGQPLSDSTKVDQFTPFNIAFSFDFSGQDVKNGDYFNFTLPSILRVSNQQFPIVDQSTGTVLANVTVNSDDNTGRVVFNSVGSDAAGTFR